MYDFDTINDRSGSFSVKYDKRRELFGTEDLLPMWVADMDFKSPPEVVEAARKLCDIGVFGYSYRPESSIELFVKWVKKRHSWDIKPEWITSSPGIVATLPLAVRVFTEKGDKVLIQTPVYPPFHAAVKDTGRSLVFNTLINNNGYYTIDFEDFENKLKSGVKLFILCSPHNPIGRVWSRDELTQMGDLCVKYGVTIISDEIHSDLALYGNIHIPTASVSESISAHTLTAMAPSKTFNIAGMMNSVILTSSPKLLAAFNKELHTMRIESGNLFGHITMEAAYRYGENWLNELIPYLEGNIDYLYDIFCSELPYIKFRKPEASFLLWMDFRATGYTHQEVWERLVKVSKLGLNDGEAFGKEGNGFMRLNIAVPRSVLSEAAERFRIGFKR